MKKVCLLLILIIPALRLFPQKQTAFLEIGDKKMFFELEERLSVYRTVTDTIIKCKSMKMRNFRVGTYTEQREILASDLSQHKREIFREKNCIWTRVTNDVMEDRWNPHSTQIISLNDSSCYLKLPAACYRIDTVIQVNPVNLSEEMVIQVDSFKITKFNLGAISKAALIRSVSNQFDLGKNNLNLRLVTIDLDFYNNKCSWLEINYDKPEQIELAKQTIQSLPEGTNVVLYQLKFNNTNGRNIFGFYDIAMMKLIN